MRLLLDWLLSALCLWLIAHFVPGIELRGGIVHVLIAAAVFGLLNATLGFLLKILTLPLGILTLGLFFLVINALILELTAHLMPSILYVRSFGAAFIGAIILAILHMLLGGLSSSKA
jgi:putative membrane protein